MTKSILKFVASFILISIFACSVSAEEGVSWYVKRSGNARPAIDENQRIIEKYNGYYIYKNVSDTSAEKIIKKVIRDMKLPPKPLYPFVALGARLFGGFSLSEHSPEKAMEKSTLPIIFFHGDSDRFVPMYMSVENYDICTSAKKELVITEKAGHGLCFMLDEDAYIKALEGFFGEFDGTEEIRRELKA